MKKEVFKAVKVSENVYWVGAIDWSVRDFHGYLTSRGTTYNAYLVLADKITLIDTVKAPFKDELMGRIASIVDPKDIDIIISNHSEMDHSGCLTDVMEMVEPEKVYASGMGVKNLAHHFGPDLAIEAVKDGQTVSLGNMDIVFMETRMLHWPDSMFSYLPGEKLLFSQDGFGMHLASYERFADEIDDSILDYEAAKYFANILMPYAALIPKVAEKIAKAGFEPAVIAPDHGPIWRTSEDIEHILNSYAIWSAQKPEAKAVVVYDTMWNATDEMSRAVCEGLESSGVHVKLMPLKGSHRSDVVTEVLDAGALLVGSPTINNNLFPTLADVLSYLKGLKPKNILGAAFGSYGWSGEAVPQIEKIFEEMKIELGGESVKCQYVPTEEDLVKCHELGAAVGKKVMDSLE